MKHPHSVQCHTLCDYICVRVMRLSHLESIAQSHLQTSTEASKRLPEDDAFIDCSREECSKNSQQYAAARCPSHPAGLAALHTLAWQCGPMRWLLQVCQGHPCSSCLLQDLAGAKQLQGAVYSHLLCCMHQTVNLFPPQQ